MARNSEKAQAMLNRWVQMRKDEFFGEKKKRPFLASEVDTVYEAERWRKQVIGEISREVTAIQNGSLGEHKIRDMNEHINKLLREKKHWERQIRKLGGPDYTNQQPAVTDGDGKRAIGADGYYYFGAARELPGVRELFERSEPASNKRTRYELYQLVNADYYGYRDDDDGLLEKLENRVELEERREAVAKWKAEQRAESILRLKSLGIDDEEIEKHIQEAEVNVSDEVLRGHVVLPSQDELEAAVLARKKKELLAKYG